MHDLVIIKELVLILAFSVPVVYLFNKINISSIVAFLVTGIILGPYVLGFIEKSGHISIMAEIGVVLLMFSIGLEFSVDRLFRMRKLLLLAGGSQVLVTIIAGAAIFYLLGTGLRDAVFFGLLISFSSTALVLKIYTDSDRISTTHGKISIAVLLFQDLAIVPALIFLPFFSGSDIDITAVLLKIGTAALIITALIVLARFLVPKLLLLIARMRAREIFTIGIVLLAIGIAYITEEAGLTLSIGAFIAGVVISESDFSHLIFAEVKPFKDVFNSIFFVSIGLMLNLNYLAESPATAALAVTALILLKGAVVFLIVKALNYPARTAFVTAFSLAQIGEFSFIIAQQGLGMGLLSPDYFNLFLSASIFTMALTPFMIMAAERFSGVLDATDKAGKAGMDPEQLEDHVIIAGFGPTGRDIAGVLADAGIRYTIIELNPDTFMKSKSEGIPIIYGDISKEEILRHAGIERARVMVITIPDDYAVLASMKFAKELNPNIQIIVRTPYTSDTERLMNLGADQVVSQEFETAIQILIKVLFKYHIPVNIIMQQASLLRDENYKILRTHEDPEHKLAHLDEIIAKSLTETVFIKEGNTNAGKNIKELNVKTETGAAVISIIRGKEVITLPAGEDKILEGDTVVITGTHNAVDRGIKLLDPDSDVEI